MAEKRTFAPVPDFMAEMAAKTPGGKPIETAPESSTLVTGVTGDTNSPVAPNPVPAPVSVPVPMQLQEARPLFREREAFQKMSLNMPKGLYEELRTYMKLTDIPMSDIIVEATRRELARLKKLGHES